MGEAGDASDGPATAYPPGFARRAVLRLSTIELWERYSFFTLFAMLALYATATPASGGLGWEKGESLRFFGLYLVVVQVAPLAGGWIVDKFLTASRALGIGAMFLLAGHVLMAMPSLIRWAVPSLAAVKMGELAAPAGVPATALTAYHAVSFAFYAAIALIAVGNGLFKPVLTVIIGRLPHASALAREAAFSTFFVFINIGGLFSLLLGGWLSERFGWGWVFAGAAVGMLIAAINTAVHRRKYIEPFEHGHADTERRIDAPTSQRSWTLPVGILIVIFIAATMFSYQSYGFVALFTETYVDRVVAGFTVPTPWFTMLNPLTIMALSPVLIAIAARGYLGGDRTGLPRLVVTFLLMAAAFALIAAVMPRSGALAPAHWLALAVVLLAASELTLQPTLNAALTRLAPPGVQTLAVGALSAAAGIGAWLSGQLGALLIEGDIARSVGIVAAAAAAAGLVILLIGGRLRQLGL